VVREEADDLLLFCSLQSKRRSSKERTRSWRWTPWSSNRGGWQSPEVRSAEFAGFSLAYDEHSKTLSSKGAQRIISFIAMNSLLVLLTALKTDGLLQMISYTVEAVLGFRKYTCVAFFQFV
jgi:hypothetical protein